MKHAKLARYLLSLGVYGLGAGVWAPPSAFAAADLFVGNFFGPGNEDVLRYNGSTGAFVSTFVPTGSGGLTITGGVILSLPSANTAGAVAGTLISTFFLLPVLGLSGTLLCLAGLNALCALGALALGPASGRAPPQAGPCRPFSAPSPRRPCCGPRALRCPRWFCSPQQPRWAER